MSTTMTSTEAQIDTDMTEITEALNDAHAVVNSMGVTFDRMREECAELATSIEDYKYDVLQAREDYDPPRGAAVRHQARDRDPRRGLEGAMTRRDRRELQALLSEAGGLESLADTARRWGLSKTQLHNYARVISFPTPVGRVASGRIAVYLGAELDAWRVQHAQTREDPRGDLVHRGDEGQAPTAD